MSKTKRYIYKGNKIDITPTGETFGEEKGYAPFQSRVTILNKDYDMINYFDVNWIHTIDLVTFSTRYGLEELSIYACDDSLDFSVNTDIYLIQHSTEVIVGTNLKNVIKAFKKIAPCCAEDILIKEWKKKPTRKLKKAFKEAEVISNCE